MAEKAALLIRASSDKQDETNQVDEVDGHVNLKGYEVARRFSLHDVSASKGEQEPVLQEILQDVRDAVVNTHGTTAPRAARCCPPRRLPARAALTCQARSSPCSLPCS